MNNMSFKGTADALCLPVFPLSVQLAPHKTPMPERLRQDFKHYAIEDWCQRVDGKDRKLVREAFRILEVHHVLPRYLGGTNEYPNLALVEPKLHRLIHQDIGQQTRSMKPGETHDILLPALPLQLVWGVDARALRRWRHISPKQRVIIQTGVADHEAAPFYAGSISPSLPNGHDHRATRLITTGPAD